MAEGHNAVAFSFSVTPDGVDVNVNHDALRAVWHSGVHSWKKRFGRFKNRFHNGVYPASPASLLLIMSVVLGVHWAGKDPSFGLMTNIHHYALRFGELSTAMADFVSCVMYSIVLWLASIMLLQYLLKAVLTYKGWMFDPRGKPSWRSRIWMVMIKLLISTKARLFSYQASLPKLPVPSVNDTMRRYLRSVRPLKNDEQYRRMEKLVEEFKNGIGPKLQRYLILKSWWATNYISDWWEEYVYLRGRSPIMVNSNFYGIDAVFSHPSTNQAARAANVVYAMLQFRRSVDREELPPIMAQNIIPLCSWQYERQFNTCRIPGIETDTLMHWQDSKHLVVHNKGRYFKVYIHYKGKLLSPSQLEIMFQKILDDTSDPASGEENLASLTAGDRIPWAKARGEYFVKGINKNSLDAIEKSAFMLVLDDEPQDFDVNDPSKLDRFGRSMLHGKGNDRWFDKTFNLIVCSNGRVGFNAEHSWADAPIMGHLWESTFSDDRLYGYTKDGKTRGEPEFTPPNPIRLQWEIPVECRQIIDNSMQIAQDLVNDVDLHILTHTAYGKGFIKKCRVSPDAYIQMALQLAYYRDAGKFCLTYEASMTRLYREGRTETVRSCTNESSEFVRAMEDRTKTREEKIKLLNRATDQHQDSYKLAMTGGGIDRHLFCLYVVSKYLGIESPFLKEVLSEPWRLSTSQTPHQQTSKIDLVKNPDLISAGGGFGPVADDGYGVSYIIAGENVIFFHISCKNSCAETDSKRFARTFTKAMDDMKNLFSV